MGFRRKSLLVLTVGSVFISVTTVFLVRVFLELIYKGNSYEYFINNDSTENNVDAISLEEIINNFIFN